MQSTASRSFTCRYWALGPKCPNGDRCPFAHADTGLLASPTYQPGTCIDFSRSRCCCRSQCAFEHRHTGVTGMRQGTIELVGFELQIANIAYASGFNTANHEALFSLIWAIKRAALQAKPPDVRRPRPPPHPVYPDRYRPSGVGDNRNRKRKRFDDVELKFHPVPALTQKTGTKANPIALESDGEETNTQASKKKAKNNQGAAAPPPTPKNAVVEQILKVRGKLEAMRLQVNGCQAEMKLLFDKHSDSFDNDDTLKLFESLAEAMNKAYDGAQDAGKFAEKAASLFTFGGAVF